MAQTGRSDTLSPSLIGYEVPARVYCRECAPSSVVEFMPRLTTENEDYGIPYCCDDCGKELAACQHQWGAWAPWFEGGEFRMCERPHCEEIERRS